MAQVAPLAHGDENTNLKPAISGTRAGCGTMLIHNFYGFGGITRESLKADIISAWRLEYTRKHAFLLAVTGWLDQPGYAEYQEMASEILLELGFKQVAQGYNSAGHHNNLNTLFVWARAFNDPCDVFPPDPKTNNANAEQKPHKRG